MATPEITTDQCKTLFEKLPITYLLAELESVGRQDFRNYVRFIKYVFNRGGYGVEEVSLLGNAEVHLYLYASGEVRGRPTDYIQIKLGRVHANSAEQLQNRLRVAPSGTKGYLITTGDFAPGTVNQAQGAKEQGSYRPEISLIDGRKLERYIRYTRVSRHETASSPVILLDSFGRAEVVKKRQPSKPLVLTVANNKGGVGKTTTALNLASGLTRRRDRVLLIDLDAQANLTKLLPNPSGESSGLHIGDYLTSDADLSTLIQTTDFERLWLIPSHRSVGLTNSSEAFDAEREIRFIHDLSSPSLLPPRDTQPFDWIILDTPPDMYLRTRMALAASHHVLVPAESSVLAHQGLSRLLDTVDSIQALTEFGVNVAGCVITRWQDSAARRDAVDDMKQSLLLVNGIRLFNTRIPHDNNIEIAHHNTSNGGVRDLLGLSRTGAAAKYKALLEEVLAHVNNG